VVCAMRVGEVAAGFSGAAAWAIWLTGARSGPAGAFCGNEATRVFEAVEPGAAIFCAETTPKAARLKLVIARIKAVSRYNERRVDPKIVHQTLHNRYFSRDIDGRQDAVRAPHRHHDSEEILRAI
jgi:hypothetical protein